MKCKLGRKCIFGKPFNHEWRAVWEATKKRSIHKRLLRKVKNQINSSSICLWQTGCTNKLDAYLVEVNERMFEWQMQPECKQIPKGKTCLPTVFIRK